MDQFYRERQSFPWPLVALYFGKIVLLESNCQWDAPSWGQHCCSIANIDAVFCECTFRMRKCKSFPLHRHFRKVSAISKFWRDICGYIKKDSSKIVPTAAEDSSCCYHVIFPWAPAEKKVGPVDNRFYGLMSFPPKFFFTVSTKKSWVTKVFIFFSILPRPTVVSYERIFH